MTTDVMIIGGGAAGLCAAVCLKQLCPDCRVQILEALPRVGKKLAATGNGRCNITNRQIHISRYHGQRPAFCRYALETYPPSVCEAFFGKIGVPFVYEGDKAYPASLQAASVVDCLRFAAEELGVRIDTETKVTGIRAAKNGYQITAAGASLYAETVIVAAGLFSGGNKLGCDGSMLAVMKKLGFRTVPATPAIVQLKTETDTVRQLKGIKVNAAVTLKIGGKPVRTEYGETLFCDYGLSGPPVLQISREVPRTKERCTVCLDLMPEVGLDKLTALLFDRANTLKKRNLDEFFTGMLNKRLGQVLLKNCGCRLSDRVSSLDSARLSRLAGMMKRTELAVTGTTGFSASQVTAGGLDTAQFCETTMMSKMNRGLYAIGEILDIDGDCGGFNLQWAWASAMCAANDIAGRRRARK